jgi:hypothetical protein
VKGSDMPRNKSSISRARSYREIGQFWEVHDLSDFWSKTKKVKFDVDIASEVTYYPIERDLAEKIQSLARTRGVSPDTLVNLWLEQNQRKGILK